MNLRDLQYLRALAEHGHFARAAEACFVSQPTLSTQLRKLEDELGVQLVERNSRKLLLTEAGRAVLARARQVLEGAEDIRRIARDLQDVGARSLRLGIIPTLASYLLPHVLPAVRKHWPKLELLLVEEKTEELLARLHDGRLDAALLALPVDQYGLHAEFVFEEPFVLAVPAEHALAHKTSVRLEDLDKQKLLLLEEGHCLRNQALEVCRAAGTRERPGFRATSLETLRYMVAAGAGLTLLPVLATKPPVARISGLKLLRFRGRSPSRRLALLWRESTPLAGLLRELSQEFRTLPRALLSVSG